MAAQSDEIQTPRGNVGNKINQEVGKMSFGNTKNAIDIAPFLRPQSQVKNLIKTEEIKKVCLKLKNGTSNLQSTQTIKHFFV